MHAVVYQVVVMWHIGLIAVLTVHALRARSTVVRAIALDTLALVFVATLAVVGIRRGEAGYLDVALALALLGFAQTVGTARFVERTGRPS